MPHLNHRRGDTRQRVNLGKRCCSCSMCGNPRNNGWDNNPTRQELKAELEDTYPRRPKAKKGPKRFAIQKRWVNRLGLPGTWWTELKRYRTKQARDQALLALRKSVWCHQTRLYQQGEEGVYTGPSYEYRIPVR